MEINLNKSIKTRTNLFQRYSLLYVTAAKNYPIYKSWERKTSVPFNFSFSCPGTIWCSNAGTTIRTTGQLSKASHTGLFREILLWFDLIIMMSYLYSSMSLLLSSTCQNVDCIVILPDWNLISGLRVVFRTAQPIFSWTWPWYAKYSFGIQNEQQLIFFGIS